MFTRVYSWSHVSDDLKMGPCQASLCSTYSYPSLQTLYFQRLVHGREPAEIIRVSSSLARESRRRRLQSWQFRLHQSAVKILRRIGEAWLSCVSLNQSYGGLQRQMDASQPLLRSREFLARLALTSCNSLAIFLAQGCSCSKYSAMSSTVIAPIAGCATNCPSDQSAGHGDHRMNLSRWRRNQEASLCFIHTGCGHFEHFQVLCYSILSVILLTAIKLPNSLTLAMSSILC